MTKKLCRRRKSQKGVTLIELMIAILVLTVGLMSLAQLFVVSTLNNALAINTSGAVNDSQRLIEALKIEASTNGISSSIIRSSSFNTSTNQNPLFATLTGYTSGARYKEYVWVFDWNGNLVGSATPTYPPGVPTGTLRSVGTNSRLIYIRMEPVINDPRLAQVVTLAALINGK